MDGEAGNLVAAGSGTPRTPQSGGRIKLDSSGSPKVTAFSARPVKNAAALFERVRVDGAVPTTADQVRALLTWIEGARLLGALDRAWPARDVIPPEDTLHERLQWHVTELQLLDRVLALGASCAARGAPAGRGRAFRDPTGWNRHALDAYVALPTRCGNGRRLAEATRPLDDLRAAASPTRSAGRTPIPSLARLADAVRRRDHARLRSGPRAARPSAPRPDRGAPPRRHGAPAERCRACARRRCSRRSSRAGVAGTAPGFRRRVGVGGGRDPGSPARTAVDVNALQDELNRIEDDIRRHVQELAAVRAWGHAVAPTRLTRSVPGEPGAVRLTGAPPRQGHGPVPRAAQGRDPRRDGPLPPRGPGVDHADLPDRRAAADPAGTCSTSSSSTRRRRPAWRRRSCSTSPRRIVVIGDDKQVSPAAVGVDQQQLRDLANQYLYDDRYRASWQDPQRSLFDEAKMRYGGMLTLIEHRRCVPEIIGFSNRIAYEPDGIRLVPVRQYGADRLEPIRPVFVAGRLQARTSTSQDQPARGRRDRRPDREVPRRPALRRPDLRRHLAAGYGTGQGDREAGCSSGSRPRSGPRATCDAATPPTSRARSATSCSCPWSPHPNAGPTARAR